MQRCYSVILALLVWSPLEVLISYSQSARANEIDAYSTSENNMATRSDVFMPITTFFLPGLSQWISGQIGHAAVYSGVAVGGAAYAGNASKDIDVQDSTRKDYLSSKSIAQRKSNLGLLAYQGAGGYSLFHSFRTAACIRQETSKQYSFLDSNPQPIDIALAPFHFQFLAKSSTYIPLAVAAALNYWIVKQPAGEGWVKDSFRKEDAAFASGFAYNAGTHEEAVFRGWMMPVLHEYGMNDPWSNGVQATAFAAAHLGSTSFPIVQLLLGWHFGSITQKNHWDFREAVFIHAWWDVFAFAAQYHTKQIDPTSATVARLTLPPVTWVF